MSTKEQLLSLNQKMAEFLQLNQYQQRRVAEANEELLSNVNLFGLCDAYALYNKELEEFLSTDQYTKYFRNREMFTVKCTTK